MSRRSGMVWLLLAALWCGAAEAAESGDSPAARRQRVERMSPEEKHALLRQQERFAALDAGEQERLRRLHRQIEQDPRRDELLRVMKQYHQWLATLTFSQRAELAALEPDRRIERMRELLNKQKQQRRGWAGPRAGLWGGPAIRLPEPFTPEDAGQIRRWIGDLARRHRDEFLAELPAETRARLKKDLERVSDARQREEILFWWTWLRWQLDGAKTTRITDRDLAELSQRLSPGANAHLANLPGDQRRKQVADWIRQMVFRHFAGRRFAPLPSVVREEELSRFWEKDLDSRQRERLQNLPPEEMRRAVWLSYLWSKLLGGPRPFGDRGGRIHRPGGMPSGRGPGNLHLPPGPPGRRPEAAERPDRRRPIGPDRRPAGDTGS